MKIETHKYKYHWKSAQIGMIGGIDYLVTLPYTLKEEIHYRLAQENFEKGSKIFIRDQACKQIYFIVTGEIQLIIEQKEEEFVLDTLHTGAILGAYSILNETPFQFSAKAVSNVSLLVLNRDDLFLLAEDFENLSVAMERASEFVEEYEVPLCDYQTPKSDLQRSSTHFNIQPVTIGDRFRKAVNKLIILNKRHIKTKISFLELLRML